ncbi:MAG: hypothetical protein WC076_13770 [Terrimicrobiaceae bacterium]
MRPDKQAAYVPFDPVSKRTGATLQDATGKTFHATKGMPAVILALCNPDDAMRTAVESQVTALAVKGMTAPMIIALALLDDLPITTIAFDHAKAAPQPVKWDMPRVFLISSVLGIASVVESIFLLFLGKELYGLDAAHIQTMMLFSSRCRH